jgi:hypothetical protein
VDEEIFFDLLKIQLFAQGSFLVGVVSIDVDFLFS